MIFHAVCNIALILIYAHPLKPPLPQTQLIPVEKMLCSALWGEIR